MELSIREYDNMYVRFIRIYESQNILGPYIFGTINWRIYPYIIAIINKGIYPFIREFNSLYVSLTVYIWIYLKRDIYICYVDLSLYYLVKLFSQVMGPYLHRLV